MHSRLSLCPSKIENSVVHVTLSVLQAQVFQKSPFGDFLL